MLSNSCPDAGINEWVSCLCKPPVFFHCFRKSWLFGSTKWKSIICILALLRGTLASYTSLRLLICVKFSRGVLCGKVGTWMCGPDRVPFWLLRFTNGPLLYLKIGLDVGRFFCKMLNFSWIFPLVYLLVDKNYLCIPIYMVKSTDWF